MISRGDRVVFVLSRTSIYICVGESCGLLSGTARLSRRVRDGLSRLESGDVRGNVGGVITHTRAKEDSVLPFLSLRLEPSGVQSYFYDEPDVELAGIG